jgi:hypothetical protein
MNDTEMGMLETYSIRTNGGVPHFQRKGFNLALPILFRFIGYKPWLPNPAKWIPTVIYWLFIFTPCVLSLVHYIMHRNVLAISYISFNLIMPVQYALGVRYIQTNHIQTVLADCQRSGFVVMNNFILFVFIVSISILTAVCFIIIWAVTKQLPIFYELLDVSDGSSGSDWVIALMIINSVCASVPLATNLVLFWMVFRKHVFDINKSLENIQKNSWGMTQIMLNNITEDIVSLRTIIADSVDKTQGFYTSTTVLGAIALGPILDTKNIDPFLIFYTVVYILTYTMCIYFIRTLAMKRESILSEIMSPVVMYKFLVNVRGVKDYRLLKSEMDKLQKAVPSGVDTLNRWKAAAYEFHDHGLKLEEPHHKKKKRGAVVDEVRSGFSQNKIHTNEVLTQVYKTVAIINWQILREELKEEWANFNILGIPFNGNEAVKKGLMVTSGIILASSYITSFTLSN